MYTATHIHQSFTSYKLLSKRVLNWMPGTLSLTHRHRIPSLDETDHLEYDLQAMSFRKEAVGIVSYIPPSPIPIPFPNAVHHNFRTSTKS